MNVHRVGHACGIDEAPDLGGAGRHGQIDAADVESSTIDGERAAHHPAVKAEGSDRGTRAGRDGRRG
jgi:hypothetical protein